MVAAIDRVGALDSAEMYLFSAIPGLCPFNETDDSGRGFLISLFTGNLVEAPPVDGELAIAGETGPSYVGLPVLVEATCQLTVGGRAAYMASPMTLAAEMRSSLPAVTPISSSPRLA